MDPDLTAPIGVNPLNTPHKPKYRPLKQQQNNDAPKNMIWISRQLHNLLKLLTYVRKEANCVDPDQSDLGLHCLSRGF